MMPEIEVLPLLKNGKTVATVTMIYGFGGWKAHIVHHERSNKIAEKLGQGPEKLGPERARELTLELAEKWRAEETRAGRY